MFFIHMMMKRLSWFLVTTSLFTVVLHVDRGWAWSVPTHEALSRTAVQISILNSGILKGMGFENLETQITGLDFNGDEQTYQIGDWFRVGTGFEDAEGILPGTGRYLNHFHNPLADMPDWPAAGLSDISRSGVSAALWAQDGVANPNWSWPAVRESFYQALTQPDKEARDASFARVFAGLGHVIHLIQDMAQPAHVRNDAHPLDDRIGSWLNPLFGGQMESWARDNPGTISAFANLTPADPTLPLTRVGNVGGQPIGPIADFWDTDEYQGDPTGFPFWQAEGLTLGLAEYTNGSYFSADTINSSRPIHQFPRPPVNIGYYSVCRDNPPAGASVGTARWYISRYPCPTDPAQRPDHFLAQSLLGTVLLTKPDSITPALRLDDRVMADYARDLIPRAVGYSAALIDYFFRGQLAMEPLDQTHLRVTNLSDEPLQSGTIELYSDDEQGTRGRLVDPLILVVPVGPGESTPPMEVPDLAARSLGGYTAVFRGTLGVEEDAIIGTGDFRWVEEWDQGLTGRHPWYQTTNDPGEMSALPPGSIVRTEVNNGILTQENTRPAGTAYQRPGSNLPSFQVNQSYLGIVPNEVDASHHDAFPLTITPQTEVQLKVDVMSINVAPSIPQCPDNEWGNGAYQEIGLWFDNGYHLELTVPGQQRNLTDPFNPLFVPLGEEVRINLYEALQARGVSITAPLAIELVTVTQLFLPPCDPTTEEQQQLLQVDYLRFVDVP